MDKYVTKKRKEKDDDNDGPATKKKEEEKKTIVLENKNDNTATEEKKHDEENVEKLKNKDIIEVPDEISIPKECVMAQTLKDEKWRKLLAPEFNKPYYKNIEKLVLHQRTLGDVYPPVEEVYNAFNCCPLDKVKVVIIGQDPYFNPGQAEGLCFSVKKGVPIPPSLNRIYKVVKQNIPDFKIPKHGSLREWAERGVLMLNATLTVDKGNANSHAKFGWQDFTTEVMNILNKETTGLIYLLWGGFAQKKGKVIDKKKHIVLEAAHPSPMGGSAWNSCDHFAKVNELLKKAGKEPMDWTIS